MKVIAYLKQGNSFPIILENNEKKYLVKLREGMSGKHGLISEWLGNQLGSQLGLNTQTPLWFELDNKVIIDDIYIEVKELIHKSFGLNIGFQYQENALDIKGTEIQELDRREAEEIFLFDIMMINIDRTSTNTNLMRVKDKIHSIDYESSLLVQELIDNKNLLENKGILTCFRNNPLYMEIDDASINRFLKKTKNIRFKSILSDIPKRLLGANDLDVVLKGIEKKKSNNWLLKETMNKLKNIEVETQEEQKERINRNQDKLKNNMKNFT